MHWKGSRDLRCSGLPTNGPGQKRCLLSSGLEPSAKDPGTRKPTFCLCWRSLWWAAYVDMFGYSVYATSPNCWTPPIPRLHKNQIPIINFTITTKQCWQTRNHLFHSFMVWPRVKHAINPGQLIHILCKWD